MPYDKRSRATMAYVGSLVGITLDVDKSTLNRTDYVRVKIGAKDITKVPEVVEGAIIPFLYDFFYERELECAQPQERESIRIEAGNDTKEQPSPKKWRTE
jgi:hypothetical protein